MATGKSARVARRWIALKCPRRGQYGHGEMAKGIHVMSDVRVRKLRNTRRPGPTVTFQRAVLCRDCGHSWWTTFFDSTLKMQELLAKQKQQTLPGVVPAGEPVQIG